MCLTPTSLEFGVKVSEDGEGERGREGGGRLEGGGGGGGGGGGLGWGGGGVRFRLVKSREAVILLSWREKVLTWSQRTSASPRFPPLQSLR